MTRCGRCHGYHGDRNYCALCSEPLCPACMAAGCCGLVPALAGVQLAGAYREGMAGPMVRFDLTTERDNTISGRYAAHYGGQAGAATFLGHATMVKALGDGGAILPGFEVQLDGEVVRC